MGITKIAHPNRRDFAVDRIFHHRNIRKILGSYCSKPVPSSKHVGNDRKFPFRVDVLDPQIARPLQGI